MGGLLLVGFIWFLLLLIFVSISGIFNSDYRLWALYFAFNGIFLILDLLTHAVLAVYFAFVLLCLLYIRKHMGGAEKKKVKLRDLRNVSGVSLVVFLWATYLSKILLPDIIQNFVSQNERFLCLYSFTALSCISAFLLILSGTMFYGRKSTISRKTIGALLITTGILIFAFCFGTCFSYYHSSIIANYVLF